MPTQPPSDRTRAAFRRPELAEGPPSPEFGILTPGFSQKMRNEPNFTTPTPKKYETNPIPAHQVSRPTPKMRNEPNPTRPTANRQQPKAVFTKRTQFTRRQPARSCETNPISSGQQPTAKGQQLFLRNEPNFGLTASRCLSYFLLSTFSSLAGNSPRHPTPTKQP